MTTAPGREGRGDGDASMGPRGRRRGDAAAGSPAQPRRAGFNGATANSPWMTDRASKAADNTAQLQWGHGEFAVDDVTLRSGQQSARAASMGPRRIRRG